MALNHSPSKPCFYGKCGGVNETSSSLGKESPKHYLYQTTLNSVHCFVVKGIQSLTAPPFPLPPPTTSPNPKQPCCFRYHDLIESHLKTIYAKYTSDLAGGFGGEDF